MMVPLASISVRLLNYIRSILIEAHSQEFWADIGIGTTYSCVANYEGQNVEISKPFLSAFKFGMGTDHFLSS